MGAGRGGGGVGDSLDISCELSAWELGDNTYEMSTFSEK